jgi:hypothetical protein
MFEGRRAGESRCTATVDASPQAAGAWPESQCFQRYIAKVVGIAVAISGQVNDSLRNDLLDDARLAGKRAAHLVESDPHGSSRIGAEKHVLKKGNSGRHQEHSSRARATRACSFLHHRCPMTLRHFRPSGDYVISTFRSSIPAQLHLSSAWAPTAPSPQGEWPPRAGGFRAAPSCGRGGLRRSAR